MGSLWAPYGMSPMGSLWGPLWGRNVVPPPPQGDVCEQYLTVVAEGLWGPYGLPMGSLWGSLYVPYGMSPMGSLWDVPYGVAMPPSPRRVTYVYYEQYVTVVAEGLWGPYGSLWGPYGMSPMGSQCSAAPAGCRMCTTSST